MTEPTPHTATWPTKPPRALGVRILIWIGVAFLLFNTLGVALFFVLGSTGGALGGFIGGDTPLLLSAAVAGLVLWKTGGFNVLRTWGNKATADFSRQETPDGGHLFKVRPARASRGPAIVLLPLGLVLSVLMPPFLAFLLCFAVLCIFLLPGARERRPVDIAVSPRGLQTSGLDLPLADVDEISVGNNGVHISREPLMAGPGGVSTSALVGRGLARRQVDRSYTLRVRREGASHGVVVAGGLTLECAESLGREIMRSVERFSSLRPAGASAGGAR